MAMHSVAQVATNSQVASLETGVVNGPNHTSAATRVVHNPLIWFKQAKQHCTAAHVVTYPFTRYLC
jgi:hypothetical protein